ncbi:MAG TPA: 2-dehydropantoate 2-reductase [Chloroflexota bacterium]|jgi:2-dehydropantoate 2-reductase|nr:2-dehydropantoate 2-reductase [Chloroflexota bacterium]
MSASFAVVGAGSLGQAFAGALAANGNAVTVLSTARTAEGLRAAGTIRLHGAIELDQPIADRPEPGGVALTTDPAALPADAGVIFTPKGYGLPAAIGDVRAAWRPGDAAWVCGIQNGIVKDDLLAAAFGPERVVGAVTILGAQREPDGRVGVTSRGATFLGEFSDRPSPRVEAAAAALNAAGVPTEAVTNIRTVLWSKMCNAVGLFAVTCLARITTNRFGHYPELVRAYGGLIRETAAIAAAQGIPMGDYPGFPIKSYLAKSDDEMVAYFAERAAPFTTTPGAPESRTSMYQDLVAGRPLEVEAIYADVVARAERFGVPAPRLTLARDLVRAIDPGRRPAGSAP